MNVLADFRIQLAITVPAYEQTAFAVPQEPLSFLSYSEILDPLVESIVFLTLKLLEKIVFGDLFLSDLFRGSNLFARSILSSLTKLILAAYLASRIFAECLAQG